MVFDNSFEIPQFIAKKIAGEFIIIDQFKLE